MDNDTFELDMTQARRALARAASAYANAAFVAQEVSRRMAERLEYIRCDPRRILDAGAGAGENVELLSRRFSHADIVAMDIAQPVLSRARGTGSLLRRLRVRFSGRAPYFICGDFENLPLKSGSVGFVWSNLALGRAGRLQPVLSEFNRVLMPGGLLMFSHYGPDTLKELKSAFGAGGDRRVHVFPDMHDLGDQLVANGFAAPVMDMEMLTLTYSDVAALARDLKNSGQTNARQSRSRGLMGRGIWANMRAAYERRRQGGKLPATLEIVYGHAWKGEPRNTADGRQIMRVERNIKKSF